MQPQKFFILYVFTKISLQWGFSFRKSNVLSSSSFLIHCLLYRFTPYTFTMVHSLNFFLSQPFKKTCNDAFSLLFQELAFSSLEIGIRADQEMPANAPSQIFSWNEKFYTIGGSGFDEVVFRCFYRDSFDWRLYKKLDPPWTLCIKVGPANYSVHNIKIEKRSLINVRFLTYLLIKKEKPI